MTGGVVVVGAGPTGLTLACGLCAAGVSVRLLDAAAGPATTSRALGLQPRGVEVLTRIGALADLPRRGLPIRAVMISVQGRALATLRIGEPTRLGGPRALLMSQADIERALRDRLTTLGGRIEWGLRVTAVEQSASTTSVLLDDGTTVDADWVVGADGAHSAIRKAAGFAFPGMPVIERFLLADVHADLDRDREAVAVWLRGELLLAAFPLPGADLWRLMAPALPNGAADPQPDEIVDYLSMRLAAEANGTVKTVDWASSFRIQRRLADTYRRGRVLLAGDAAHIHSPLGGQGLNTGIGDAENLAWKLALVVGGRAEDALLDTYEAERRPIAEEVLANTTGLTRLVTGESRGARLLRDRIFVPLLNRGWVQRQIAESASQLKLSYRRGPLGGRRLVGPTPGDRVSDRSCASSDGTTRLHAALGPQWALLGSPALAEFAAARLGEVAALDPHQSPAMLIRPDGHLAWRGSDAADMNRWLDSALCARPRAVAR